MLVEDIDFGDGPPAIRLRPYQERMRAEIHEGFRKYGRILAEAATGTGKTSLFAVITKDNVDAGGKTLVIVNRERLVNQAADRIRRETGLPVEIEMAGESASPYAPVVVASVQTLMRVNRLTSFADTHFSLVIADECHHALAAGWLRVLHYFHYGAQSLVDGWEPPPEGIPYEAKCRVLGVTATPDEKLGQFFQHAIKPYLLLQAVADGWLVKPIAKSIPLNVDLKGLRAGRTVNGSDLRPEDVTEKLIPVIEALAKQIAEVAADRKTIAFTPSVQCARLLNEAVIRNGLNGIFVSGECLDVDEKTEAFVRAGRGTVLSNCALYCEGADFPDVDCVVIARATKSVAFYRQMVGRGTRVLPGVVDGLETAEERRAAIAASAKPELLIVDPLWISDRIPICDAYDLVTDKAEIKERMKESGDVDLEESEKKAERDLIAALAKEARKHARRQARTIDPLAHAVSLGDAALASWTPEAKWDMDPITEGQADFLRKHGVNPDPLKYKGLAQKVIGRLIMRMKTGLATPRQLEFLAKLGFPEDKAATMTIEQATSAIDAAKKEKGWK